MEYQRCVEIITEMARESANKAWHGYSENINLKRYLYYLPGEIDKSGVLFVVDENETPNTILVTPEHIPRNMDMHQLELWIGSKLRGLPLLPLEG